MTEEEAREKIEAAFGPEIYTAVGHFLDLVVDENSRQNLVAASTLSSIWARHAWDSLQLLHHATDHHGLWIDIGSGGGFPGVLIALARPLPVLLVEPRRKRADFLRHAIVALGLEDRVRIAQQRIERLEETGAILSARAVSGIEPLFEMAHHCATLQTRWLLPRGTIAFDELTTLKQRWRFMFHVEQSEVASESQIAIFDRVMPR